MKVVRDFSSLLEHHPVADRCHIEDGYPESILVAGAGLRDVPENGANHSDISIAMPKVSQVIRKRLRPHPMSIHPDPLEYWDIGLDRIGEVRNRLQVLGVP